MVVLECLELELPSAKRGMAIYSIDNSYMNVFRSILNAN